MGNKSPALMLNLQKVDALQKGIETLNDAIRQKDMIISDIHSTELVREGELERANDRIEELEHEIADAKLQKSLADWATMEKVFGDE